jgi:hypothetical protein
VASQTPSMRRFFVCFTCLPNTEGDEIHGAAHNLTESRAYATFVLVVRFGAGVEPALRPKPVSFASFDLTAE